MSLSALCGTNCKSHKLAEKQESSSCTLICASQECTTDFVGEVIFHAAISAPLLLTPTLCLRSCPESLYEMILLSRPSSGSVSKTISIDEESLSAGFVLGCRALRWGGTWKWQTLHRYAVYPAFLSPNSSCNGREVWMKKQKITKYRHSCTHGTNDAVRPGVALVTISEWLLNIAESRSQDGVLLTFL